MDLIQHPAPSKNGAVLSVRKQVLSVAWRKRRLSRADIARTLKLSRSTVSGQVQDLIDRGLLVEAGRGESRGGRRPIMLDFQYDALNVLGIDIGATHVSVVLTDLRGQPLQWRHEIHPVRTDPEGTRELLQKMCDSCLLSQPQGKDRLVGIGIAVPSPVDPANPEWLPEVVIPDWQGHSELGGLRTRYDAPVFIENDATLGALAEHYWGAGRGVEDFIYVKVGRGVGAGMILGGKLYRGASGIAGELGHLSIDPKGPPCVCGQNGCLVKYIGSAALVARAKKLASQIRDSVLAGTQLSLEEIVNAALQEDSLACMVVQKASNSLASALAGYVHILNPRMVIIAGGITRAGKLFITPIEETIARTSIVPSVSPVKCCVSQLGAKGVAIGAATLGILHAFRIGLISD